MGKIEKLPHSADGSVISNLRDGYRIHQGYKAGIYGKEFDVVGVGRLDFYDTVGKVIHQLKPNNARSITRGIAQLHRYNAGLGGGHK